MSTRALLLATALAAATATTARAESPLRPERIPNKARHLAEKGRAAHKAGDYNTAVAAFKEAYVLAPSPGLLFNIAQSYRLAGNCDESAWMYRRFLDSQPAGNHRQLAETHLAVVEKCGRGGLRVSTPEPMRDDATVPEPTIEIAKTHAPHARSATYKKVGIGTAVGGGALLVGAAYFAYDANDASNTVADTYRRGGKWSEIAGTDARGRRSATLAAALGVGGGLAVATGAVLFVVGRHYEQARPISITPTAHGAHASMSWDF